jgi:ABC-type uncharacterized transport system fused permease/ATPase subunit
MGIISLNITEETAKIVSDIVVTFVDNWIPIVIFTLCLSFIVILVFLCTTQLPRVFTSMVSFIDTATVNFPVITKSIHDLILNVEKMNSTLVPLLSMQNKVDSLKTFMEEEFDAIKEAIRKLSNKLP